MEETKEQKVYDLKSYFRVRTFLQNEIRLNKLTISVLNRSYILKTSNLCRKLCEENNIKVYRVYGKKTKFRPKTALIYPYEILCKAVYETN